MTTLSPISISAEHKEKKNSRAARMADNFTYKGGKQLKSSMVLPIYKTGKEEVL